VPSPELGAHDRKMKILSPVEPSILVERDGGLHVLMREDLQGMDSGLLVEEGGMAKTSSHPKPKCCSVAWQHSPQVPATLPVLMMMNTPFKACHGSQASSSGLQLPGLL
jgi:hypothetical protein